MGIPGGFTESDLSAYPDCPDSFTEVFYGERSTLGPARTGFVVLGGLSLLMGVTQLVIGARKKWEQRRLAFTATGFQLKF